MRSSYTCLDNRFLVGYIRFLISSQYRLYLKNNMVDYIEVKVRFYLTESFAPATFNLPS